MELDEKIQQKKYLIVVFGPPASGKTNLAHSIQSDYFQKTNSANSIENSLLISADCVQEYLRTHSVLELESLLSTQGGWKQLAQQRIKRSQFNEIVWKVSRQFIKQNLLKWLKKTSLLIIEDDLLLKSQRKQIRQIVESSQVHYLELYPAVSYKKCRENLKKRSQLVPQNEHISEAKLQECFDKFQSDQNPYCYALNVEATVSWTTIQNKTKTVIIEHPELKQKQIVNQENAAKDQIENQIRSYISQILNSHFLMQKFCRNKDRKEAALFLGKVKKSYRDKNKSLMGFIALLEKEIQS